jgi:uncharacterized protein (TIGR02453 family)
MPGKRDKGASSNGRIHAETFRFFRDLDRNNRTEWMEKNRERYQSAVVQPFRGLLEELTPAVLKLDPGFDVGGRTGVNFSRINRDIRFAKDKTPYRPQMYLLFPPQGGKNRGPGELYIGIGKDTVTAGFRVYLDRDTKAAALGSRMEQIPKWCAQQKRRLARGYESYWYSMEKGEWTKHEGWPVAPEEWKKLLAWIVRRKLSPAAAARPRFARDAAKIFKQVLPLFRFIAQPAGRGRES